jgi:hypothetical protein
MKDTLFGGFVTLFITLCLWILGSLGYGWHVSNEFEVAGYFGMLFPMLIAICMMVVGILIGAWMNKD